MPRATVNEEDVTRKDLKSCPEGFVVIRTMTYGEFLHRREMIGKLTVGGDARSKQFEGEMKMANAKVTEFEFTKCIVDHNLDDDDGNRLDFTKSIPMKLDPRIGEEIGTYIDELNQFDADSGN